MLIYICVHAMCGGQSTFSGGSWLSPFTLWVLGLELKQGSRSLHSVSHLTGRLFIQGLTELFRLIYNSLCSLGRFKTCNLSLLASRAARITGLCIYCTVILLSECCPIAFPLSRAMEERLQLSLSMSYLDLM